jgi:TPR repeat protein/TolB-like protein
MSKQNHITLVLALNLLMAALPAAPATNAIAPSNYPPRLVVAVLPFENATGDVAQRDWQQALPALIRTCLDLVDFVSAPRWKRIQPALARAGCTATNSAETRLARLVARDLKAHLVVWGRFRCESNGWAVDAKMLRANSESAPVEIQASATGWVDLAESVSLRVAKQFARRLADDDREFWRMNMPHNEKAASRSAKAICLQMADASTDKQEEAWRAVLAVDPLCGMAYTGLISILFDLGRQAECKQVIEEFLRQQPGTCHAHLAAALSLTSRSEAGAEAEMLQALRLHRGCPDVPALLFQYLAPANRWTDLVKILKEALAKRPDAEITRLLLANALVKIGDRQEARVVLEPIDTLPDFSEGSTMEELALCQAAFAVGREDLGGLELLRLGPQALTNSLIRGFLEAPVKITDEESGSNPQIKKPRSLTLTELSAELEQRLTAEERSIAVNPVEITPEVRAEAGRLTTGITNEHLRALALFAGVAQRGRGLGDGGQRTASQSLAALDDPETRLSCQEHAKLFVACARALGLEAWIAHVEQCADGSPGSHDCAALFVGGSGVLVDPTWGIFGVRHQKFTVLDDLQAISHQAMQGQTKPDTRRLRMGLKLNPEDRWTRLQFVRGMAAAGEYDAANEELRKVKSTGVETWDVHEAAGELEIARWHWKPALDALQRSLILSPSNAAVHFKMSAVCAELQDLASSKAHLETALRLDRGEFSRETRRQSESHVALLTAVSLGQSGGAAGRETLKGRAEAGDCAAQIALAKVCLDEQPPRIEEGMRWLLLAANSGHDGAQFQYALRLLELGGSDAAKEALPLFSKSANQGNAAAQYRLGLILYEGKLAPRDNVAAGQWVYLAADQGYADARRLLTEMKLFVAATELAEARKRADAFKPAKATGQE